MKKAKVFFMTLAGIFSKAAFRVVFGIALFLFIMTMLTDIIEMDLLTRIRIIERQAVENMVWDSHTLENITYAQLRGLTFDWRKRLPPELYIELFSVPLLENNEELLRDMSWKPGTGARTSFSSAESARNAIVTRLRTQNPDDWSCEFIGENDYFYQFRVVRLSYSRNTRTDRMIFFKDSAITFPTGVGCHHPLCGAIIHKTNAEDVVNILDLLFMGSAFVHREFYETDRYFQYTSYTLWMYSHYLRHWKNYYNTRLERTVWTVDREDG